ncbi:MAG: hypothetical protein QOG77_3847 [Solirubrobacteraceae bacterium]|nr:hypothetical protein [Solirubrobacteraceae bacterium]
MKLKPFGVIVGLLGNILIAIAMRRLLISASCAGFDSGCTDDIGSAAGLLPVGIIIATVSVFLGGWAISFLGTFLAVGIGALLAAAETDDGFIGDFGLQFGGIFVAVPLLLIVAWFFTARAGGAKVAQAQSLVATGARGVGTISSVADTGMTINDNPRVNITMRIEPEDGSPAFDAQKTVTVSRVAIPRAGDRFPVWYDRNDPTKWAYGTDMNPAQTPPEIQSLFARAAGTPAGAPATPAPLAAESTADQLTKLNELRLKGVLTDAEFEAAKGRLLT